MIIVLFAMVRSDPFRSLRSQPETHRNRVGARKRQAIEGVAVVFSNGAEPWARKRKGEARDLHARIGESIV